MKIVSHFIENIIFAFLWIMYEFSQFILFIIGTYSCMLIPMFVGETVLNACSFKIPLVLWETFVFSAGFALIVYLKKRSFRTALYTILTTAAIRIGMQPFYSTFIASPGPGKFSFLYSVSSFPESLFIYVFIEPLSIQ
jgi:hypothetical protein